VANASIITAELALAAFLTLNAIIGIRLLWLASRTRERPELYLGIGHLFGGALGWALLFLGFLVGDPKTSTLGLVLMVSGLISLNIAHLALALFAWRVFNPERRLLGVLFFTLVAVLGADFVHNGLIAREFAPPAENFWYWPGAMARNLCWFWLTSSSFLYWRKLRRRLRIGLADPVAANRVFLLFLTSALITATALIVSSASVLGIWAAHPHFMGSVSMLLALPAVLFSWLAFIPPARYTDWIERRAQAQAEVQAHIRALVRK